MIASCADAFPGASVIQADISVRSYPRARAGLTGRRLAIEGSAGPRARLANFYRGMRVFPGSTVSLGCRPPDPPVGPDH